MLNVSILNNQSKKSVEGAITINVTNLLGQKKAVKEMKIVENDSVSYAFFSDISNQETLIYNLSISPEHKYSKKIQYINKFFINWVGDFNWLLFLIFYYRVILNFQIDN